MACDNCDSQSRKKLRIRGYFGGISTRPRNFFGTGTWRPTHPRSQGIWDDPEKLVSPMRLPLCHPTYFETKPGQMKLARSGRNTFFIFLPVHKVCSLHIQEQGSPTIWAPMQFLFISGNIMVNMAMLQHLHPFTLQ